MKVLHIVTHLVGGGAEKNAIDSVKGLDQLGYEVHLMTGGKLNNKYVKESNIPPTVKMVIISELARNISPISDYIAYRKMLKLMTKEKYQIVHTHMAKAGVLGRLAANRVGVPLIVCGVHGMLFSDTENFIKRWIYKKVERYCGRITDHFITVGEDLKRKYISAGIGEPEKYHVINTGIDIEKFRTSSKNSHEKKCLLKKEIGLNDNDIVVGMVTRFDKNKGVEYFIDAAADILSKIGGVKFVLVGDGIKIDHQKRYAKKLNILDKVIFTGYRSDIADVMSIFDIAVLTSLREGVSRFLVQAALMAKPIVTFDVDGAWEIVNDGENGFIVPMKDVRGLSDKICYLASNEELRAKMGKSSANIVGDSRTVENMVLKINELYENYAN